MLVAACTAFVLLFVGSKILLPPPEIAFSSGVLMLSSLSELEICRYPDSGKLGAGPPHDRRYFPLDSAVDYWHGE